MYVQVESAKCESGGLELSCMFLELQLLKLY